MDDADATGTLLVAVANQETADRLIDTAVDVAADRSYRVVILYVVEVPPQVPLSEGEAVLDGHERTTLEHAEAQVDAAGVRVESRLRYARDVATGIVGGAAEHGATLALLGWRGRPPRRDVILGSYLDRVLRNAPCDVLVKRIRTPQVPEPDSVLVPVADGPHTLFATAVGGSIAARHDATLTLLHVLPVDPTDEDRAMAEALVDRAEAQVSNVSVERRFLEREHVPGALTDETAEHDVTVIGASEEHLLRRKLVGSVTDAVGRHGAGTVLIAQRHPSTAIESEAVTNPGDLEED